MIHNALNGLWNRCIVRALRISITNLKFKKTRNKYFLPVFYAAIQSMVTKKKPFLSMQLSRTSASIVLIGIVTRLYSAILHSTIPPSIFSPMALLHMYTARTCTLVSVEISAYKGRYRILVRRAKLRFRRVALHFRDEINRAQYARSERSDPRVRACFGTCPSIYTRQEHCRPNSRCRTTSTETK